MRWEASNQQACHCWRRDLCMLRLRVVTVQRTIDHMGMLLLLCACMCRKCGVAAPNEWVELTFPVIQKPRPELVIIISVTIYVASDVPATDGIFEIWAGTVSGLTARTEQLSCWHCLSCWGPTCIVHMLACDSCHQRLRRLHGVGAPPCTHVRTCHMNDGMPISCTCHVHATTFMRLLQAVDKCATPHSSRTCTLSWLAAAEQGQL